MSDAAVPSFEDTKSQLEQRYIQLLEQRIKDLETLALKPANEEDDDKTKKDSSGDEEADKKNSADVKDDVEQQGESARKSRIRRVISKLDSKTGTRSDIEDSETKQDRSSGFEVTFREVPQSSPEEKDGYCEVDIKSGDLRALLKATIGDYPGQSWEGDVVNIVTPFSPMVHKWQALEDAASKDDPATVEVRKDLRDLLDQISTSPELKSYFKTRQSYLDTKIITYDTMWSLFVPGQNIYAKPFMGEPQLFTIETTPYPWPGRRESGLEVGCWCYEWDGAAIIKAYYDIPIEKFRGTKPVIELPCYPLEYFVKDDVFEDRHQLLNALIRRGERYNRRTHQSTGVQQMSKYDGDAIAENRNTLGNDDDDAKPRIPARLAWFFQEEINAAGSRSNKTKRRIVSLKKNKFVIDCGAFLGNCGGSLILGDLTPWKTEGKNMDDAKFNAENALRRLKKAGTDEQQSSLEDIPVEEKNFLALLPPRYLGYSLQNKFWGQFSVDRTSAPDEKDLKAFQTNLQLNQEYKDLIKALVSKHDAGNNSDDGQKKVTDIVAGKGKGLVILLHGPPGVGKTLTAETIAEGTGKPLFVVSVAEIGLDAAKAERNLQQMFDLASAWGAILLVDEADVFLESRSSESGTERNALVSVLLRVLEYYHGIMILTTNRIRHLDIAVQSRIHLAIRYQELDKGQKARIFGFYLDQLEADSIYRRDRIDDWVNEYGVEHELNGRQIRNLVSAALALARNEEGDQRVTDKHLKKVAKVVNDFIKELQSTVTNSRMSNEVGLKT